MMGAAAAALSQEEEEEEGPLSGEEQKKFQVVDQMVVQAFLLYQVGEGGSCDSRLS